MKMGTHAVCTRCKHIAKHHRNVNEIWEFKSTTIRVTDEERKKAFYDGKAEKEGQERAKGTLEQDLLQMEVAIGETYERFKVACEQYEGLAMSTGFISRVCSVIELLRYQNDVSGDIPAPNDNLSDLQEIIDEMRRNYKEDSRDGKGSTNGPR
jgi:hypothetical protein